MDANEKSILISRLAEDLGSIDDAQACLPAALELRSWSVPQPSAAESARIAAITSAAAGGTGYSTKSLIRSPFAWLLLRGQARMIYREIWPASLFVLLLGWSFTWLLASSGSLFPIALIAPLVSAVGVALIYGRDSGPGAEIELATPVPPTWILLARLTLVFAYNLLLGLGASALLASFHSSLSFWTVVLAWLAPMAFLSGLSFFVTVLFANAGIGVTLSMAVWAVLNLLRYSGLRWAPFFDEVARLFGNQGVPWLWTAAIGLIAAALWLARNEERWLRAQG